MNEPAASALESGLIDVTSEGGRARIFPRLSSADIARIRPLGQSGSYAAGQRLRAVGEIGQGFVVILSGYTVTTERGRNGQRRLIEASEPGSFHGELAQLSGRPWLVDIHTTTAVEALTLTPEALRALLISEADLGERIMSALILRRARLIEEKTGGPVIVGASGGVAVLRLETFLERNAHPWRTLDAVNDPEALEYIEGLQVAPADLPFVLCPDGQVLRNPTVEQLARCISLVGALDPDRVYDVAVVGAGPAGLATAVYAGSEGLATLALDAKAFGGQAGASARIENYLGFPTGISGLALAARAHSQAQKFGVEMAIPEEVVALEPTDGGATHCLRMANGERVRARTVVIASGAHYRSLAIPNLDAFEMTAVHYWASPIEARLCMASDVALVGAGNSAGQAVVYLAAHARRVFMLVRAKSLDVGMSRYLVDRIHGLPNVVVMLQTEAVALEGQDGALEVVRWRSADGEMGELAVRHLFLFTGADPSTCWLEGAGVALDPKGFVLTGIDAGAGARGTLETSRPGVFAIGDVRAGSTKRVSAAVGDGAQVVAAIHAHLAAVPVA
jgi:thioredoxin reductase (NADPH)